MRDQYFEYNNGANGFLLSTISGWEMQSDGDVNLVTNEWADHKLTAAEFSRFRRYIQPTNLSGDER